MNCRLLVSFRDQGMLIWGLLEGVVINSSIMALFCSVREFMAFTSDVLVERTTPGQRQSVREQGICFAIILYFSLRV